MSATSRTNWFWSDWLGDQAVRRLTPAERGVWIDLLGIAAAASPIGYVCNEKGKPLTHEEIARVTNAGSPVEVAELIAGILEKGAASRDRTGRLYNRRMVREASMSAKKRLNGQAGGAATRLKWQALLSSPQQTAWQVPQQRGRPPSQLSKKDSSYSARASPVEKPQGEQNNPSGSLASRDEGALARPPDDGEQGQKEAWRGKPVASLSKDELAACYAAKSGKHEDAA